MILCKTPHAQYTFQDSQSIKFKLQQGDHHSSAIALGSSTTRILLLLHLSSILGFYEYAIALTANNGKSRKKLICITLALQT